MAILNAPYLTLEADDIRLYRILRDDGPMTLSELGQRFDALPLPSLIHRLERMVKAGLLEAREEGDARRFRVKDLLGLCFPGINNGGPQAFLRGPLRHRRERRRASGPSRI